MREPCLYNAGLSLVNVNQEADLVPGVGDDCLLRHGAGHDPALLSPLQRVQTRQASHCYRYKMYTFISSHSNLHCDEMTFNIFETINLSVEMLNIHIIVG